VTDALLATAWTLEEPEDALAPERVPSRPRASVIIPAHDEAAVILRTLAPLAAAARAGALEVIVVCNGCSDHTARVAATVPGIRVIDTEIASKSHALNLGDRLATAWPRVYLDADITASSAALDAVAALLASDGALAARPAARYDTRAATWGVRAYYRARSRVPSLHRAMWGAGCYALSRAGHARLGAFPDAIGDDLWVDRLFEASEKAVVAVEPVVVRTPRTLPALLAVTRRAARGSAEAAPGGVDGSTVRTTLDELARSVRGPRTALDACVYLAVAALARFGRARPGGWERDDTSR